MVEFHQILIDSRMAAEFEVDLPYLSPERLRRGHRPV
jgi:hypothetical protein